MATSDLIKRAKKSLEVLTTGEHTQEELLQAILDFKNILRHAETDELTGLCTYPGLLEQTEQYFSDDPKDRRRKSHSIIYLDIDEFKSVNDTLGHDIGDHILQRLGMMVRKRIRSTDVAGRTYKGDEFIFVLPYTSKTIAQQVAADVADAFTRLRWKFNAGKKKEDRIQPTLSYGIVSNRERKAPTQFEELVRIAERRMIKAKGSKAR